MDHIYKNIKKFFQRNLKTTTTKQTKHTNGNSEYSTNLFSHGQCPPMSSTIQFNPISPRDNDKIFRQSDNISVILTNIIRP